MDSGSLALESMPLTTMKHLPGGDSWTWGEDEMTKDIGEGQGETVNSEGEEGAEYRLRGRKKQRQERRQKTQLGNVDT